MDWMTKTAPALPTQGDNPQSTPDLPGLTSLIGMAKQDLAMRMSIPLTEISVKVAEEVIWPDSSLGCGKPGAEYLQVPTPGFCISLEAAGQIYYYHTNTTSQIVLCSQRPPFGISPTP